MGKLGLKRKDMQDRARDERGVFTNLDGTVKKVKEPKPEEVVEALVARRLNGTKKAFRDLQSVKKALETKPKEVTAAILRQDIAVNAIVCREILKYIEQSAGELVTADGDLPPVLKTHLLRFQQASQRSIQTLFKLEAEDIKSDPDCIADIVLSEDD